MMAPSHLAATLLLAALWDRVLPLRPRDWALAVTFGVLIDLDHALQVPRYVALHGFDALRPAAMAQWGSGWQGVLHTPYALLAVIPAALYWRSAAPFAFWGLHMVLDFVVARHYVRYGGPLEWALFAFAAILVAFAVRAAAPRGLVGALRAWRPRVSRAPLVAARR